MPHYPIYTLLIPGAIFLNQSLASHYQFLKGNQTVLNILQYIYLKCFKATPKIRASLYKMRTLNIFSYLKLVTDQSSVS